MKALPVVGVPEGDPLALDALHDAVLRGPASARGDHLAWEEPHPPGLTSFDVRR